MRWVIILFCLVIVSRQNVFGETDNLRDPRFVGIPSMNRMMKTNNAAQKEQEAKSRAASLVVKEKTVIEMTGLENELIRQILMQDLVVDGEGVKSNAAKQGYSFVKGLTADLSMIIGSASRSEKERQNYNDRWSEKLHPEKANIANLVISFFIRNNQQARLSVKSSKPDGFLVDYENTFESFFGKNGGGGWTGFYAAHPHCHGVAAFSIPVYDAETKLVLVYRSITRGSLFGSGWIFLYSYADGILTLLRKEQIWQS